MYNEKIDEDEVTNYLITGRTQLEDKYVEVIDKVMTEFATNLFNSLREEGYSLNTTQFYFVGGGASIMKKFGGIQQKNIKYNLDVRTNAKGYDRLAKIAMDRNARQ